MDSESKPFGGVDDATDDQGGGESQNEEFNPGEMPLTHQWGIVVSFFFVGGIIGAFLNAADPAEGFIGFGLFCSAIAWLVATESGHRFMENLAEDAESQQQQVGTGHSEETVVCRECGWQNPESNNYCHDCGSSLDG